MGADIHVYIERKNDNDEWEPVYSTLIPCTECKGTLRVNPHCANCKSETEDHDEVTKRCFVGPLAFEHADEQCEYCANSWVPPGKEEKWQDTFYHSRDYTLFGVLAAVRGSPDDDFTQERGVPDDCSMAYANVADGSDWHSYTWYTLAELRKYPFKKKFPEFYKAMVRMESVEPDPERIRMLMFFDN